jgi:prepilin-type N-terminal cleavage/methylation domain-containing protein
MTFCRWKKGFSLVEIMVVAALIGVMAMIAVPSIRAWVPRYQLRSVKRDIVSQMQNGRMRSIGTGHTFYIDFDHNVDGNVGDGFITCYLDTDDDGASGETNNGEGENEYQESQATLPDIDGGIPVIRLPSHVSYGADGGVPSLSGGGVGDGVNFLGGGHEAKRATFWPNGRGKTGTVYIHSDRNENYAITVNILGRVIVRKWDGTAWQ